MPDYKSQRGIVSQLLLAIPENTCHLQFQEKVAARRTSHLYVPAVRRCDLGIFMVSFTDSYVPQKFRCLQGYVNSGRQNKSKLPTGIKLRAFSGLCLDSTLKCVLTVREDTGWY